MAAKYTDVITTNSGATLPGATVQLFDGSGALVTTYTDDALTQNPATSRTADDNGIVELYVADGTYTVRQTYGSVTRDLANVELYDISTIASTSSGAVANKAQAAAIGISGSAENMGPYTGSTIPDNETAKQNIQSLETAVETKANATAVGVTSSAANMGTYTGTTIPDNETAKQNIQSLETAVETKANASAVGVAASATNMGTYTGSTITDNQTAKQNIQELETAVEATSAALAASGGAALVGFLQVGAGAVERTSLDKMRDWVNVKDFGAVGDGSTNDRASILAALAALGSSGGAVVVPNNMRCLIDSSMTVPSNCSIVGLNNFIGTSLDNTTAPYGNIGGALIVNSAATLTMSGGSSLRGLLIHRKGMTFPAADSSAFAGTAVTTGGDDVSVSNCMILGFNKAFYSSGYQRPRLDWLYCDNINNIEITNCLDVPYVERVHGWPFSTIADAGSGSIDTRSGKHIYFHDVVDWGKIVDCFSWGYARNIEVIAADSTTIINSGGDNYYTTEPAHASSIGISITGACKDTRIIGYQAAAQDTAGIYINTSDGYHTIIDAFNAWGGSDHGILIDGGDVTIMGSHLRGVTNGINVNDANSTVLIDGNRFTDIVTAPIKISVGTTKVHIGMNDFGNFSGADPVGSPSNLTSQDIASASGIQLPNNGEVFNVTGTTSVGSIGGGWKGRKVTLVRSATFSFLHGTGSQTSIRLNGAANWSAGSGTTLTLMHNGVQWYEIGRSA